MPSAGPIIQDAPRLARRSAYPLVYRPGPAADGPRACSSAGGDQGLVADGDPDAQPCLVQSALEGGLADPGDLGGVLCGESLDVTQHEGGPQRGWQLGQGPAQRPAQLAVLCLPGRVES